MPPLAALNHLVRGAQTMACMALKGRYNIALSTFTATKLNGPCLKGKNKMIYSADVMQTTNTDGLCRKGC